MATPHAHLKTLTRLTAVAVLFAAAVCRLASAGDDNAPLGSPNYFPSAERPEGWRGDGSGKYPGATPPVSWERIADTPLRKFTCQAAKASGDAPSGEPMKFVSAKGVFSEWLVLGPVTPADLGKSAKDDDIPNEGELFPNAGDKVGELTWQTEKCTGFDFFKLFNKPEKKVAYAITYFWSPVDMNLGIRLGGECAGYKYWLNGKLQGDWDLKRRPVVKGWNRLLIKAIQRPAGDKWTFGAHLFAFGGAELKYTSKNIQWITPMPALTYSCPLVIGDKVITEAEPNDLICCDKQSGQILWMHSNPVWYGAAENVKAATSEKPATPALTDAVEKLRPTAAKLEELNVSYLKNRDPKIGEERKKLSQQLTDGIRAADAAYKVGMGWGGGNSSPTPCTDGKFIYAWFGETGVLSCFDLAGNRVWTRFHHPGSGAEHGYNASPVLCGDKLIVIGCHCWIGFDKKSGNELWRKPYNHPCYSTHVYGKIGGTDVAIGPNGNVLRVADGGLVAPAMGAYDGECASAIVEKDLFFLIARGGFCTARLPANAEAQGKATVVNQIAPNKFPGIYPVGSPVFHDGLVYATHSGWTGSGAQLYAIDPQSGQLVYNQMPDLAAESYYSPSGAGIAASLAVAGNHIYMMDNRGSTIVVEPGRSFKQLSKNTLEDISGEGGQEVTQSTPIFDGARIYYRGDRNLYCIGEK